MNSLSRTGRRIVRAPATAVFIGIGIAAIVVSTGVHAAGAACSGAALATNPSTGRQEKVWQAHDGQDYELKHAENVSGSWTSETQLTFDAIDQTCPAIGFDANGNTAVVWKTATTPSRVFYRARKDVAGVWVWQSAAVEVSDGSNDASAPFVAFAGGTPWVAWRETLGNGNVRVVVAGGPGSEPWPTVFTQYVVTTIEDPGAMHLDLNSESGILWATWVSTSATLQYSVWDAGGGGWSTPVDVPIQAGDVAGAKAEARLEVLE